MRQFALILSCLLSSYAVAGATNTDHVDASQNKAHSGSKAQKACVDSDTPCLENSQQNAHSSGLKSEAARDQARFMAAQQSRCAASNACKEKGHCSFVDGHCAPASHEDCSKAKVCDEADACFFENGVCEPIMFEC